MILNNCIYYKIILFKSSIVYVISNLLIKLFTGLPRCSECVHYNKTCKVFGDIFTARTSDIYCGINARYFEKK